MRSTKVFDGFGTAALAESGICLFSCPGGAGRGSTGAESPLHPREHRLGLAELSCCACVSGRDLTLLVLVRPLKLTLCEQCGVEALICVLGPSPGAGAGAAVPVLFPDRARSSVLRSAEQEAVSGP